MESLKQKLGQKIWELENAKELNEKENKDLRNEIELLKEQIEETKNKEQSIIYKRKKY